MAWSVLCMVLGFCFLFASHGEENKSHTELQRSKLVPVSLTGPEAMHQDEAAVLGLELNYQNPDIMQMNYRSRLRRYAERKKKKHNAGAFSPLSMSQDGKKTHSSSEKSSSESMSVILSEDPGEHSRTKRHGRPKRKKSKLVKRLNPRHEHTSPTEKTTVPKRKQVKKPQPPGVFSVLSYITLDKKRSGGQMEHFND